jgi:hypothetical protein
MVRRIKAFGAFWYDFIIGDDWLVAAGVVIALALTYALSRTTVPAWWLLPLALVVLLPLSLRRAASRGGAAPPGARRGGGGEERATREGGASGAP